MRRVVSALGILLTPELVVCTLMALWFWALSRIGNHLQLTTLLALGIAWIIQLLRYAQMQDTQQARNLHLGFNVFVIAFIFMLAATTGGPSWFVLAAFSACPFSIWLRIAMLNRSHPSKQGH